MGRLRLRTHSCRLGSSIPTHLQPACQSAFRLGSVSPSPSLLSVTPPGQQEDEEDAGGGTASTEGAGEDRQESFEEHERPDLG